MKNVIQHSTLKSLLRFCVLGLVPMVIGFLCVADVSAQNVQTSEPAKACKSQTTEVKAYSHADLLALSEEKFAEVMLSKFRMTDAIAQVSKENRKEGVTYIPFSEFLKLENEKKRSLLQNKEQYVITMPQTNKTEKGGERNYAEPVVETKSADTQPSGTPSNANTDRKSSSK